MLNGLMQHRPLRVCDIIDYAADLTPHGEIVTAADGDISSATYPEARRRIVQLAHALGELGVSAGDRIATLAWNDQRHFELYYAIAGIGAVCHTINPRLSREQMLYILHHAGDRVLFFDPGFAPLLEGLVSELPKDLVLIALCSSDRMPDTALPVRCHEAMIEGCPTEISWPELSEDAACALCYTSGTTGRPKGVLYSNRAMVLHALFVAISQQQTYREGRRILPVVPLFHANAWGVPYTVPLTGGSLIMPGPRLDGASLFDLMERAEAHSSFGVPTVWLGLLDEMDRHGRKPAMLDEVIIGGAAAPRRMIERFETDYGIRVVHGWGMTEMSPVGTLSRLTPAQAERPVDARIDLKAKQGRRIFGLDLKITGSAGAPLAHDGVAQGELHVRGNTIASGYYDDADATADAFDAEGWFATGDVASIDEDGFLTITDRSKDLIKSGGEWISSLDVENVAMAHPGVASCAVIAVPHPKWDERPLLVVQPASGTQPAPDDLRAFIARSVAKWQVPDDVVFVDELPLTATGKVSKKTLRERYADHAVSS